MGAVVVRQRPAPVPLGVVRQRPAPVALGVAPQQFVPINLDLAWGLDAETNLVPVDLHHRDDDVADVDFFAELSTEY